MKDKKSANIRLKRKNLNKGPFYINNDRVKFTTRSQNPKLLLGLTFSIKKTEEKLWVSATHTRNYMLNDTLVDWIKNGNNRPNRKQNCDFVNFIMKKGIEFEKELVKYINKNILPVITVSEFITDESVKKTIDLMKLGIPLIHSAPVRNNKNKTQGIIDLLIRSDYIDKLVEESPLEDVDIHIKSPKLGVDYYYIVIDIKFSTLSLRADGIHLLNSGNYPAFKAQTWIYTQAIGIIQGYTSKFAYIMGSRWKYTKSKIKFNSYSCINKLGVINFETIDSDYKDKTEKALEWIRDVKTNGHKWSVSPPSRKELYPNMCIDSGKWQKSKNIIADDIGEISNIWYCGIKHRNIGIDKDIKSWRDKRCISKNIGINGKRGEIIDKILKINRQETNKILPKKIKNDLHDWKTESNEIFVDFETLSDIFTPFDNLPNQKTSDMIFMIGIYWKNKNKWEYTNFICKNSTYDEEYRIMDEFNNFIKVQKYPKMWYWSAENKFWKHSEKRQIDSANNKIKFDHISNNWNIDKWSDLNDIFCKEPIVIKGCFKFGLKAISNAMNKHGLINTKIESTCNNGMDACVNAWTIYQNNLNPVNSDIMKDIQVYNKFDCKVLYDILSYLRKNHV
jgi:hypothetical protein